jgi:hypothetical protein
MTWAIILQEMRQMRFGELYVRRQRRTHTMAADILGITERAFRRWNERRAVSGT